MKTYLYRAADALTSGGALGALCGAFYFLGKGRDDAAVWGLVVAALLVTARAALQKFAGHVFDDYAGCCGCGTVRKVDRYAIWGPTDTADLAEVYCWRCFAGTADSAAEGYDLTGFTYALLGPIVTVKEYRRAANDAFADRQPFCAEVTA